mgnify:FL=1|tara:strand:+ start:3388 stop:3585 length:198 start_codon:yes stop_codon:yes gene_type:complete
MNEAQIANELKKRKADLAFWQDQFNRVMGNDAGMWSICEMQVKWHRERISQLKGMRFALHCDEQV